MGMMRLSPAPVPISEWPLLGRYNYLSDWPESQSSQFHMRPGKRNADNGNGKDKCCDEIADNAERSGADILTVEIDGARHHLLTEGEQRVGRDVKCGSRSRQPDDSDRHEDRGDHPAGCHP